MEIQLRILRQLKTGWECVMNILILTVCTVFEENNITILYEK